jgi:hypothetical protein
MHFCPQKDARALDGDAARMYRRMHTYAPSMTEIFLDIHGRLPRLRRWVADLEAALGDTGRVRHSLEDGDDGQEHYRTVYVEVYGAADEVEALEHVQPILRELESDYESILRRGTTVWQWVAPAPPAVR